MFFNLKENQKTKNDFPKIKLVGISSLLFICCFFITKKVTGQDLYEDYSINSCLSGFTEYRAEIDANDVVELIFSKIGLENTFMITKTCYGLGNAYALKDNDIRYLLIDLEWIKRIKAEQEDWFELYVISHEIGHHLFKHTDNPNLTYSESKKEELEADYFAGFVLAKFGANNLKIENFFKFLPDSPFPEINTHPQNRERINEIKRGIQDATKDEESELLITITENSEFNLTGYEQLVNKSRAYFSHIIYQKIYELIYEAINKYQQAIRINNDPQLVYELAYLFLYNKNIDQFINSINYIYSLTKNKLYLYGLFMEIYQRSDFIADDPKIKDLTRILNSDDMSSYSISPKLISVIKYNLIKWEKSDSNSIKILSECEDLLKALLEDTKTNIFKYSDFDVAEIHYLTGLVLLRKSNFEEAEELFIKSLNKYKSLEENEFNYFLKIADKNIIVSLDALMLTNVRQRDWLNVINYSYDYKDYIVNSFPNSKHEIKINEFLINYYYYIGRAFHGLKDFNSAIDSYSKSLTYNSNGVGYIYYYRGLSYLGIGKEILACSDLKISCESGVEDSCSRVKLICL
jgi:tetratricopeptide (TPR) repeat protein